MATMMMKSRMLLQQQRTKMIQAVAPCSSASHFNTLSFSSLSSNPSPTTSNDDTNQMIYASPDAASRGISTFQRLNQQLQFDPSASLSKINNNKTNINFTTSAYVPVGSRRSGSTVRMLHQQQPYGTLSCKTYSNEISNNKTNINDVAKKYFGEQMK
jgi:hypothetical protein